VSAHGNSLRAIVKHLKKMSDAGTIKYFDSLISFLYFNLVNLLLEIMELDIPTAVPLVFELDENLEFVKSYYLRKELLTISSFLKVFFIILISLVTDEELEKRI